MQTEEAITVQSVDAQTEETYTIQDIVSALVERGVARENFNIGVPENMNIEWTDVDLINAPFSKLIDDIFWDGRKKLMSREKTHGEETNRAVFLFRNENVLYWANVVGPFKEGYTFQHLMQVF